MAGAGAAPMASESCNMRVNTSSLCDLALARAAGHGSLPLPVTCTRCVACLISVVGASCLKWGRGLLYPRDQPHITSPHITQQLAGSSPGTAQPQFTAAFAYASCYIRAAQRGCSPAGGAKTAPADHRRHPNPNTQPIKLRPPALARRGGRASRPTSPEPIAGGAVRPGGAMRVRACAHAFTWVHMRAHGATCAQPLSFCCWYQTANRGMPRPVAHMPKIQVATLRLRPGQSWKFR